MKRNRDEREMRDQRFGLSHGDFRNEKAHILCVVQQTSGTLDPFGHPTSESVMSRDDFEEQITRMEVPVFGLPH